MQIQDVDMLLILASTVPDVSHTPPELSVTVLGGGDDSQNHCDDEEYATSEPGHLKGVRCTGSPRTERQFHNFSR